MVHISTNGHVKPRPVILFGLAIRINMIDPPSNCLAVVNREHGEFLIDLNPQHGHVQALLKATSKRGQARALNRLLKLMGHTLRIAGGVNPIEYLATKRAVEIYPK